MIPDNDSASAALSAAQRWLSLPGASAERGAYMLKSAFSAGVAVFVGLLTVVMIHEGGHPKYAIDMCCFIAGIQTFGAIYWSKG